MAKKKLADVTLILDRSGSMRSCQDEAEGGVNNFIESQKKQDGKCLFTLIQFDDQYEFVYKAEDIKDVSEFKLVPRGMTALLDAVGRAINETSERLGKLKKKDLPAVILFMIVTDGHENASQEFKRDQIKELIEGKTKEGWEFTFLGANQDAFREAGSLGITRGATTNYSAQNTSSAFTSIGANLSGMRSAASKGEKKKFAYTDDQREAMK